MLNENYYPMYIEPNGEILKNFDMTRYDFDDLAVGQILSSGFVYPPYSAYKGVSCVAPQDRLSEGEYFYTLYPLIEDSKKKLFKTKLFEEKIKAFFDAKIPKDEKVSVLFSGGKDSLSLTVAILRTRPDIDIKLFFLENGDEEERVERLAGHLRLPLEKVSVVFEDCRQCFKDSNYFSSDLSFPGYYKLVRSACSWSKIMIDGSGNDSYGGYLFSQNDKYKYLLRRWIPRWLRELTAGLHYKLSFLTKPISLTNCNSLLPAIGDIKLGKEVRSRGLVAQQEVEEFFGDLPLKKMRVNTRGRLFDNLQIYTKVLASECLSNQILLPYCDLEVGRYIQSVSMSDKWESGRNKTFLRRYISDFLKFSYDSLPGGKQGMQSAFMTYREEINAELSEMQHELVRENMTLARANPAFAMLLFGLAIYLEEKGELGPLKFN
jgi:hypothetical protein